MHCYKLIYIHTVGHTVIFSLTPSIVFKKLQTELLGSLQASIQSFCENFYFLKSSSRNKLPLIFFSWVQKCPAVSEKKLCVAVLQIALTAFISTKILPSLSHRWCIRQLFQSENSPAAFANSWYHQSEREQEVHVKCLMAQSAFIYSSSCSKYSSFQIFKLLPQQLNTYLAHFHH